jgi:uncharacterized protein (DUF2132 family)
VQEQDPSDPETPGHVEPAEYEPVEREPAEREPAECEPAASGAVSQTARSHPNDPLHGLTLKDILEQLHARYGWEGLGRLIRIRCFTHDPSMGSSLAFLRRQPWARQEVEELFLRSFLHSRENAGAPATDASGDLGPARSERKWVLSKRRQGAP